MEEKVIHEILEKIEGLVNSADKFNEMNFRMILEGLINKGGEQAELLAARYLGNSNMELTTRINIIRVAGYIQGNHFLIPLKKIIDTDANIQLKKEAIISISKYNNRQALNILNNALNLIKNPLLLQLINTEIGKIKKNNPVIALLPRFLDGEKDQKNFNITLDILKRILTPADSSMFLGYLKCGRPLIEEGAFEILCFTAGMNVKDALLTFYQDRFSTIASINLPTCDEFYFLTLKIKQYFFKNPPLIDEQLDNLGTQLFYIKDPRIRELLISIICQSHEQPSIEFAGRIYDSDESLRTMIVREFSGNEEAVDLLFEKYESSPAGPLKIDITKSLLNSRKGLDYFYSRFPSLELTEKKIILDCLPYGSTHDISEFFKLILQESQYELKMNLMGRIRSCFEFSVKDALFDPAREDEFFFIEQEYLDTITKLFPVTTVKKLFIKIAFTEVPINKVRKYLSKILEISEGEFVFQFKDKDFLSQLFHRLTLFNSSDINILFFNIMNRVKTFDIETYRNIEQALNVFTTQKSPKTSLNETGEFRRARKNISDLLFDIRNIEEGFKTITQLFSQRVPDLDHVQNVFTRYGLAVSVLIEPLCDSITKHFSESSAEDLNQWIKFFNRYPMIAIRVREAIEKKAAEQKGYTSGELRKLLLALPEKPYKIVIQFSDRIVTAALREQCMELIPDIPLDTETGDWQEGDMLICDQEALKDFILKNSLPSHKLFLLLEKRSDFSSYKTYNPRPLVRPFSAHRIMKEILKELYI